MTTRPARPVWLLPEDGIIDHLAVEIAAKGIRPVALTPTERRLAAALILAAGGSPWRVSKHLRMNSQAAHTLAASIRAANAQAAEGAAA